MRLLLDTHAWLWFVLGDKALSQKARAIIEDPGNEKFLSPASFWETAIKISIGNTPCRCHTISSFSMPSPGRDFHYYRFFPAIPRH